MHKMWKDEGNLPLPMKLIKFPAVKNKDSHEEISWNSRNNWPPC